VVRRLLLIFLGCAVLPLVLLAAGTLEHVSGELEREARERLRSSSKAAAMNLISELRDLQSWSELGASLGLEDGDVPPLSSRLRARFRSVALARDGGPVQPIYGEPPELPDPGPEVRTHLARGRSWLTTAGQPGGRLAIVLVQPLASADPAKDWLLAEVDPDPLWIEAIHPGLPDGARFWVLDESARVLRAPGVGDVDLPIALRGTMGRAVSGDLTWSSKDETWLGGYWSVFIKPHFLTSHWTLVIAEPRSRVLAPVAAFRSVFPLAVGLGLGLASLTLLLQLRRWMAPLGELSEAAERVSRRDFEVSLQIDSGDEFEELATSFNQMAERLNEQFDSLAKLIEIDRALLASADERHIVRTLAEGTLRLSGSERVAVMVEESDRTGSMRLRLEPAGLNQKTAPLDRNRANSLLDRSGGERLRADDPDWPCFAPLLEAGVIELLALPIAIDRRPIGVVAVELLAGADLSIERQVLVRQLADQASLAITNARAAERNRRLAHFDVLTGLPNRLLFAERLEQALLRARKPDGGSVGVGLIDLDGFKRVNDTFGHGAGDELLRQVAVRLNQSVRVGTLARMGGDEFTFIVGDPGDAETLARVSRRLIDGLDAPFRVGSREIFLTASIGLAVSPADGSDVESLLRNADAAMYHAKARTGSAFRFYDASMNDAALERLELEHEIRRGIEQREFVVYYQPIVEAATRDIVGVEALVRWQHPERGLVGPDDFIPVAEETGLIVRLGEQILSTACIEMRSLAEEGHGPLRLSVNLSVRQLADPGLVSRVREVLVASGWPPSQLVLEITESMLMSPDPESNALLRSLRELGAALSIDDFGSGYSSLSYLKNFEVDHLKIDRTFVSELEQSQNDAEITAAILAMAQGLRLGVVAEGVETEGQLAYLRDRGCDWLQGYLFSPPIPLEDLRKFLVDPTRA
jgi:diguanylate cyclase (GGDEF)-like protein